MNYLKAAVKSWWHFTWHHVDSKGSFPLPLEMAWFHTDLKTELARAPWEELWYRPKDLYRSM